MARTVRLVVVVVVGQGMDVDPGGSRCLLFLLDQQGKRYLKFDAGMDVKARFQFDPHSSILISKEEREGCEDLRVAIPQSLSSGSARLHSRGKTK